MRRGKLERFDMFVSLSRQRSIQVLIGVGLLYMVLVTLEIPFVFRSGLSVVSQESLSRSPRLESEEDLEEREAPTRPNILISQSGYKIVSGLGFDPKERWSGKGGDSELYKSARVAWVLSTGPPTYRWNTPWRSRFCIRTNHRTISRSSGLEEKQGRQPRSVTQMLSRSLTSASLRGPA